MSDKKTTEVEKTEQAIPNSGLVKAQKVNPQCKVLAKIEAKGDNDFLSMIRVLSGDDTFAEQFITCVKIAIRKNWRKDENGRLYNLFDKVPLDSVLEKLYYCAKRKILPDGYNAHLVVYLGKDPKCELVIDFKGFIDTAEKEGLVIDVDAEVVKENDEIEINFGEVTKFSINPKIDRGKVIGAVAYAILPNGRRKTKFVDLEDLEKIRKCAKTDMIWKAWTDEMYKKTAIRRLFKTMRTTPRLRELMEIDNESYDLEHYDEAKPKQIGEAPVRSITMSPVEAETPNAEEVVEAEPVFA